MRPIVLLVLIRNLRHQTYLYLRVIADSAAIVCCAVVYVMYFAWFGFTVFSGTLQGTQFMDSYTSSVHNMFITITTANFPDIMLPAYEAERSNVVFFLIFTFLGLFLIMNLLLAVVTQEYSKNSVKNL